MSLRDYFAAMAMQAIIQQADNLTDELGNIPGGAKNGPSAITSFAVFAYIQADAMIAQKKKVEKIEAELARARRA
jgi:hypothetical protein